jgi:hypothetical protein
MEKLFYLITKEAHYRIQGKQFEETKKEKRNPKQIFVTFNGKSLFELENFDLEEAIFPAIKFLSFYCCTVCE